MSAPVAVHLARTAAPGAIELPIADRAALGVALGIALSGRPVVATLDGAGRLGAVAEIVATAGEIALAGGFAVPLVIRAPYGAEAHGIDGGAGRFLRLPGVTVVAGSGLVAAAVGAQRPVVVLEPRGNDRSPDGPIDRARVVQAGDQVVLASWGGGVEVASAAAGQLAREGISAAVVDLVVLSPIDTATLAELLAPVGRLVVVDPAGDPLADDVVLAALGAAFWYLEAPIRRIRADIDEVVAASRGLVGE